MQATGTPNTAYLCLYSYHQHPIFIYLHYICHPHRIHHIHIILVDRINRQDNRIYHTLIQRHHSKLRREFIKSQITHIIYYVCTMHMLCYIYWIALHVEAVKHFVARTHVHSIPFTIDLDLGAKIVFHISETGTGTGTKIWNNLLHMIAKVPFSHLHWRPIESPCDAIVARYIFLCSCSTHTVIYYTHPNILVHTLDIMSVRKYEFCAMKVLTVK